MNAGKLIRDWMAAVNETELRSFGDFYAEDAVLFVPMAPDGLQGREAIREYEGALFEAFSDIHLSERAPVLSGEEDTVAVEWEYGGRHTGPLAGAGESVAPTGRSFSVRGVSILQVGPDGRIAEERRYYDPGAIFRQLGLG